MVTQTQRAKQDKDGRPHKTNDRKTTAHLSRVALFQGLEEISVLINDRLRRGPRNCEPAHSTLEARQRCSGHIVEGQGRGQAGFPLEGGGQ